jgi:hypothetical protein
MAPDSEGQKEKIAKSKEQRAKSKEHRAESKEWVDSIKD